MLTVPINLPPVVLRAAMPVKSGQDLILSGELRIGGVKAHIITSMPFADAQRQWERATAWASSHRTIPYKTGRVRRSVPTLGSLFEEPQAAGYDDAEGIFDDIANFMSSSPIGQVARSALSFIPGVNIASNLAFTAADMYSKARKGMQGAGPASPSRALQAARRIRDQNNAQRAARGKKPIPVTDKDLLRASKAHELMTRARQGNQAAQQVIGRLRIAPYSPGSEAHIDHLALDAAQLLGDSYPLERVDDLFEDEEAGDVEDIGAFEHRRMVLPRLRIMSAQTLREALQKAASVPQVKTGDIAEREAEVGCACKR